MSGGQKAPTPYQPPGQAEAAAGFQQGANQLADWGSTLHNDVAPKYAGVTNAVMNNPYYAQGMQGVQDVAGLASSTVAPQQFAGAQQDTNVANTAYGSMPWLVNSAVGGGMAANAQTQSMIPQATGGYQIAPQIMSYLASIAPQNYAQGMSNANTAWNTGMGNANTSWGQSQQALGDVQGWNGNLMGAAGQTLNTAFDPQRALYDRSYQQMLEQTNAINSQNGVAGSPFAAGVGAQNSNNFNLDWQDRQLNRQVAGLGAYGTASGTATGNVNNTLSTGANDYATLAGQAANAYGNLSTGATNNLNGLVSTGVNSYNSLVNGATNNATSLIGTGNTALNNGINTGVSALTGLGQTAIAGNQGASDLNRAGLNTMSTAALAPSQVFLQQQDANLAALNAQTTGTNSAAAQTQQSTSDQGDYLKIGQTAASGAAAAAKQNNDASNALIKNVISGAGTIAGMIPW